MEPRSDEYSSPLSAGGSRGFAEHCSAPAEPAGCAKPAVGQGRGEGKLNATEPASPARRRFGPSWEVWFFLLAFVAIQFWQWRDMQGGLMPPLAGQLGDGRQTSLADVLRVAGGRPLLLYVWSTSCPICSVSEGTIAGIAEDWPVLTLAMQSGNVETVAKFMHGRNLAYPALVDARGEIAWSLGVRATPAWFVVDRGGTIRFSGMGYTTGWGLRARLMWAQVISI